MAAPTRSKIQREQDLERISALYCKGKYMHEIAATIGVSVPQIAYDLKKIQKRWRESSIINMNEAKQRELTRIDNLERAAWDEFERSKKDKVQIKKKKLEGIPTKEDKAILLKTGARYLIKEENSATSEGQYGDPRFLIVIKECIAKRCQILGLDEPIKFEGEITEKQTFVIGGQTVEF